MFLFCWGAGFWKSCIRIYNEEKISMYIHSHTSHTQRNLNCTRDHKRCPAESPSTATKIPQPQKLLATGFRIVWAQGLRIRALEPLHRRQCKGWQIYTSFLCSTTSPDLTHFSLPFNIFLNTFFLASQSPVPFFRIFLVLWVLYSSCD